MITLAVVVCVCVHGESKPAESVVFHSSIRYYSTVESETHSSWRFIEINNDQGPCENERQGNRHVIIEYE